MDDIALLDQFQSGALPFDTWCHRLHVRVAWLLLRQHPFNEARARFRTSLQAYNGLHDVPDTLTSGYHETLTTGWLHLIAARMARQPGTLDSESFCNANADLLDRTALRQF